MSGALDCADRQRLARVLGMLGSDHAGERDAAGLAATRILRDRGITWAQVLEPPRWQERLPREPPQTPPERSDIAVALSAFDRLTEWERGFVVSLRARHRISPRQAEILREIAAKARRAAT